MANRMTVDERIQRCKEIGIIIDPEYEFLFELFAWRISTKGYVEATMYNGEWKKTVKLHHFIVGTPVGNYEVDHINRNKLDNRLVNLRVTTGFVNARNREYVDNASNIRITSNGGYEVRINKEGKTIQIGTYRTLADAILNRDKAYEI